MDRSAVTLERMRTFVRVVERGNMTAAAREQNVGQSTITRQLAELEQALGVTLLNRTTRRITLTDEGQAFYSDARSILRLVEEATDDARSSSGGQAGKVRVSCTAALGVRYVSHALFAIQDRHPEISIDLKLSDERIDLVREATDIAIRLGPLSDSSMQYKPVGQSHRVLVASRDYLNEHGRPVQPDDVLQHQIIRMSNIAGSEVLHLKAPDGTTITLPFESRVLLDHGLAAREAIAAGRGIAAAHVWLINDLLATGAVEIVMPDYIPDPVQLSILMVPARHRIQRVRTVVDAISVSLKTLPGLRAT